MFGLKEFANRFEHFLAKWKLTAFHDRRRINMYEYIIAEMTRVYISVKNIRLYVVEYCKLWWKYEKTETSTRFLIILCKCPLINAHLYPRRGEIANEDKNTRIINSSRRERTKDELMYLRNMKRKIRGKVISFLMDTDWKFNVAN